MKKIVCAVGILILVFALSYLLYHSQAVTVNGVYVRHEFSHELEAFIIMLLGAVTVLIGFYIPSEKD